jgi:hypothetical protein
MAYRGPIASSAAPAASFGAPSPQWSREIKVEFRPWTNPAKTVLGWLRIELPSGLILVDAKLMVGPNGKRWIAMPAVPAEGSVRRDGKTSWKQFVEFRDKATRERFQAQVLAVLRKQCPEAFLGEAGEG